MKTAIVPAQILTIEDRIGELSLTQICLMVAALIFDGTIGECFPPTMHFSIVKIVYMSFCTIVVGGLATRLQEMLVMRWLILSLDYCLRPRYFVYHHEVPNDYVHEESLTPNSKNFEEERRGEELGSMSSCSFMKK